MKHCIVATYASTARFRPGHAGKRPTGHDPARCVSVIRARACRPCWCRSKIRPRRRRQTAALQQGRVSARVCAARWRALSRRMVWTLAHVAAPMIAPCSPRYRRLNLRKFPVARDLGAEFPLGHGDTASHRVGASAALLRADDGPMREKDHDRFKDQPYSCSHSSFVAAFAMLRTC